MLEYSQMKHCVVGSLMNIVKIKARLQYMGE